MLARRSRREHSKGAWRSPGRCDLDRLKSGNLTAADMPKGSVLNGDDQDRRRLPSPFAGPPTRFVSSPWRPPPQVSLFSNVGFELPQILFGPRIANGAFFFRHGFHSPLRRIDVAIVAARVEAIRLKLSTS